MVTYLQHLQMRGEEFQLCIAIHLVYLLNVHLLSLLASEFCISGSSLYSKLRN